MDIVLDGYGDFPLPTTGCLLLTTTLRCIWSPHQVAETLVHPENLKLEEKKNLQDLLDGLAEDDNAIIIYGKIK